MQRYFTSYGANLNFSDGSLDQDKEHKSKNVKEQILYILTRDLLTRIKKINIITSWDRYAKILPINRANLEFSWVLQTSIKNRDKELPGTGM